MQYICLVLIEVYFKLPILLFVIWLYDYPSTMIMLYIWLFCFWFSKFISHTFIINCAFYYSFYFLTLSSTMFHIILSVIPYFVYFCLKSICPSLYFEMFYISWLKYVFYKLWSGLYTFCAADNLKPIPGWGPESFWMQKKNYLVKEMQLLMSH